MITARERRRRISDQVFKAGKSVSQEYVQRWIYKSLQYVLFHSIQSLNSQTLKHTVRTIGTNDASWTPNGTHRCFAMERMKDTLEDILKKQDNVLTVKQAKRILDLYVRIHTHSHITNTQTTHSNNTLKQRHSGTPRKDLVSLTTIRTRREFNDQHKR